MRICHSSVKQRNLMSRSKESPDDDRPHVSASTQEKHTFREAGGRLEGNCRNNWSEVIESDLDAALT